MSLFDPVFLFPLLLVVTVLAGFAVAATVRVVRARRKARRRVRELPNSHFTSDIVQNNEARHRWHNIALERLHEINREEVQRLIARVEATSVEALRPNERAFLDRMAELAGTRPIPETRESPKPKPSDLRHRPA
jgi:uncharacterized membrane protein